MVESLTPRAITPKKQSYPSSCVPTAVSMILSGFGIVISEQDLIDQYYPTAIRSSARESRTGVSPAEGVRTIVQILKDKKLAELLRVDVFTPWVWRYTLSNQPNWIIPVTHTNLEHYVKREGKSNDGIDFYTTLAQLVKSKQIGVQTINGLRVKSKKKYGYGTITPIVEELREELIDYVKKGHIIGSTTGIAHGHVIAMDGIKTTDKDYYLLDPKGRRYRSDADLMNIRDGMITGGQFDYMTRISPRTREELNPQHFGFSSVIQTFRSLIPGH